MQRSLHHIIVGQTTHDGAGVRLKRSLGQNQQSRLDPFLMLDEFVSDEASDYIGGFPEHPHRGFETVTYMLEGHMLHQDHLGNRGHLRSGDVQWMTAGRGIIHSEMPQQESGRMHGFQLWINLPAAEKMKPASYRDIPAAEIPQVQRADGGWIKVIAGDFVDEAGKLVAGPIQGLSTEPLYLDVHLPPQTSLSVPVPSGHQGLVYAYAGEAQIADQTLIQGQAGILNDGDQLHLHAGDQGLRALVLAGRPIGEPVVQYGPFVMNTREEIEQTLADYRAGRLVG